MNLTSPSQVKAWCIANDFHPNRVLGQNFLIDQNALKAIVDAGFDGAVPRDGKLSVLEIGPGLGVMTEEMLARGASVTAIEKDPAHNRQIFEKYPGRVMVCKDETCTEQSTDEVIDLELTI